jgi:hypothetical protein
LQTEELLVKVIFNNQLAFCGIFGALGGVVHVLDIRTKLTVFTLVSKIIVSSLAGILLFFATYDISQFSPSLRITAAIVTGFYGSSLFRYLSRFYLKQILNAEGEKVVSELEKNDTENPTDE